MTDLSFRFHRRDFIIPITFTLIVLFSFIPKLYPEQSLHSYDDLLERSVEYTPESEFTTQQTGSKFSIGSIGSFNSVLFIFEPRKVRNSESFFLSLDLESRSIWIPASNKTHKLLLKIDLDSELSHFLSSLQKTDLVTLQTKGVKIRLLESTNLPTEFVISKKLPSMPRGETLIRPKSRLEYTYNDGLVESCPSSTVTLCGLQNSSLSSLKTVFGLARTGKCVRSSNSAIFTIYEPLNSAVANLKYSYVYFSDGNSWHCPYIFSVLGKTKDTFAWFNPVVQFNTALEFSD